MRSSVASLAVAVLLAPGLVVAASTAALSKPAAAASGATEQAHVYDDAGMIGFGSVPEGAPDLPQPLNSPVFSGAATSDGGGYVLASADGGVFASAMPPLRDRRAASR